MGESLTRRNFVKTAGAITAGATMTGLLSGCSMTNLETDTDVAKNPASEDQEYTCTCSWSCSFCQYHIYTRNGNVSHMLPKPDFDYRTCLKGRSRIARSYSEERIQYPMKRVDGSARGAGEWERITWDEAAQIIVDQWQKTEKEFGALANTYYQGGGGAQGSLNGNAGLIMRLFNALGCTKWDYSFDNATNTGLTRGGIQWFDQNEPKDFINSDYILIMGGNPVNAQIQMWQHIANAQDGGTKLVVVDPLFSATVAKADKWIPVKPGCDTALYLGLIRKFMEDKTYDTEFVLNHTCAPYLIHTSGDKEKFYVRGSEFDEPMHVGPPFWVTGLPTEIDPIMVWSKSANEPQPFDTCTDPVMTAVPSEEYVTAWDVFKDHVQEWTLEKVMATTGISEENFNFLYDVLQPKNKVTHYINFGTGAYENGLHAAYAMTALIAMTGNFGEPGRSVGGFDAMYGNFFGHALCTPSNGKTVSPVTFLAACDIMNTGKLMGEDYPIKNLWVSHGGLIGGSVNSNRVKHELLDKMDLIVVQDPFMTDTARYADILLPVTDMYEFEDVVPLSHEHNVRLSEKCIEPMYEAKTDSEIARLFGEKFGLADAVCDVTDDDWWKGTFDDVPAAVENGITMETLRENKLMRYTKADPYIGNVGLSNFITETGRLMFYVDEPAPRTPSNYDISNVDRERMPTYFENIVSGENSAMLAEYPLVCTSWRNPTRVHMTMFMKTWAKDIMPEPTLFIHPEDAQKYGIEDGMDVKIHNQCGHCVLKAVYHTGMRLGTTCYFKGYAENETKSGSLGSITTDYADPYAVNCSFFDNRIAIEPWDGTVEE